MSNRGKKVALETKTYEDGTVATGPAPLPDESPAEGSAVPTPPDGAPIPAPENTAPDTDTQAPTAEKPKAKKADKGDAKNVVVFKSSGPETVAYDIRVRGIKVRPAWDAAQTHLLFDVPAELADDFALHTHVVNGRVVRAE
jgi:hypothetical protein